MIRPERLRLGTADASANSIDVTIDEVINYGDSILAIGQAHGLPLRARIGGGEPAELTRGATVTFHWSPGDAHILPRPQGA